MHVQCLSMLLVYQVFPSCMSCRSMLNVPRACPCFMYIVPVHILMSYYVFTKRWVKNCYLHSVCKNKLSKYIARFPKRSHSLQYFCLRELGVVNLAEKICSQVYKINSPTTLLSKTADRTKHQQTKHLLTKRQNN